jgi:hypothetical protein
LIPPPHLLRFHRREVVKAGISRHADQHDQSGVDVAKSKTMEGNRKAGDADDGDEKENIKTRTSFHADEYRQSGVDVPKSKTMEENRKAGVLNS